MSTDSENWTLQKKEDKEGCLQAFDLKYFFIKSNNTILKTKAFKVFFIILSLISQNNFKKLSKQPIPLKQKIQNFHFSAF